MKPTLELTEEGRKWIVELYPPGILWDYDPEKPFDLVAATATYFEVTQDGIPLSVPHKFFRKSSQEATQDA